jgi:hypothetical protein
MCAKTQKPKRSSILLEYTAYCIAYYIYRIYSILLVEYIAYF